MRAAHPDLADHVVRDGVRLGYEVFGHGEPTILLMPTWTIIHSRFWKLQVPYLSRHYRVVTYDGPGNGRSDRVLDPERYSPDSYASDAAAVLDACGVSEAFVVGLSRGGMYGIRLASLYPQLVTGLVLIGPALPLGGPAPGRERIAARFRDPYPVEARGWDKYNLTYWHDHYEDFAEFFFSQMFSESHSTKQREDAVGWALETTPDVLEAEASAPEPDVEPMRLFEAVRCPTLVIHGSDDRIISHEVGVEAARLAQGSLLTMAGSGHGPMAREPVRVNLAIREFVERLRG